MMLDEAREGEKATPLRMPDSLLERSYVRTWASGHTHEC
jgi:hypothetical protein